jgi:hypothetical protein
MNRNEEYWGEGISIISQNFSKSPSILFHPLDSSVSKQALRVIGPRACCSWTEWDWRAGSLSSSSPTSSRRDVCSPVIGTPGGYVPWWSNKGVVVVGNRSMPHCERTLFASPSTSIEPSSPYCCISSLSVSPSLPSHKTSPSFHWLLLMHLLSSNYYSCIWLFHA